MSSLLIGVLALQGAVKEHTDILTRLGVHTRLVKKLSDLDGLHGLIVPGGESTAIARLAAPSQLLQAVRARIDQGDLVVFGTCAGLILLADIVAPSSHATVDGNHNDPFSGYDRIGGLDVVVSRNAYGNQQESFEALVEVYPARINAVPHVQSEDLPVTEAPTEVAQIVPAAFIRAPRILSVGPLARVLATHEGLPVAVVQGNLIGATFHPEIVGNDLLHRAFVLLALSVGTTNSGVIAPAGT